MGLAAASGTKLVLIRHGETEWNSEGRIQGHLDVGLSERGIRQTRLLAARLAAERPGAVYTSDLRRASETARIACEGLPPPPPEALPDARLREACLGSFEGHTREELLVAQPEAYAMWAQDSYLHRPPGGETIEELMARCRDATASILASHPGETLWVFTHGGPIRVILCAVLDLPPHVYGRLRVENTSVTRIAFSRGAAVLETWNDVSHLVVDQGGAPGDWRQDATGGGPPGVGAG
jgi:broad specificity phosphatase PhoE